MKKSFKKAISFIEIGFIIFVLFFVYTFVIKQMFTDMKFSDLKRSAATTYTRLSTTTRHLTEKKPFAHRFKTEQEILYAYGMDLGAEKMCRNAKTGGCWSSNWIWADLNKPGIKLQTGEFIAAEITSPACMDNINILHTCGALYVDTNGSKAPNRIGNDIIKLYVTQRGLVPAGLRDDTVNTPKSCDMAKKFSWACTARLLGVK